MAKYKPLVMGGFFVSYDFRYWRFSMAFYFKEHRYRIARFMAAGNKDVGTHLKGSSFVKTSNGYWLAWHSDTIEKIAVLPPEHPRELPCEWLHDAKSIEEAVHIVESGKYVRTTGYGFIQAVKTIAVVESKAKKPLARMSVEPRLTKSQQIALIGGEPMASVLTDKQQRHLQWRKKVRGELSPDTEAPSFYLYAVHEDGCLTYQFKVKTMSPKWYIHTYIHPTWTHFQKHHKVRHNQTSLGCMICKQQGRLLAEIHLLAESLSELTVIHESVHASIYFSRIIDNQEAKTLAAPYVVDQAWNMVMCRDEIQCRMVEFLSKQIVMFLHTLSLPCVPLRIADIIN